MTDQDRRNIPKLLPFLEKLNCTFRNNHKFTNSSLKLCVDFEIFSNYISQAIFPDLDFDRLDTLRVRSQVSQLFKNNPHLIVGFNEFLPPGMKIDITFPDTFCAPSNRG